MKLTDFYQSPVMLSEGGNIFKGDLATGRINLADVVPTVKWLEKYTGLPLIDNMLGTTGKKSSSGDLDLGVDQDGISKDELVARLSKIATAMEVDPKKVIKKSGISVHFRTPITGDPDKGFVQSDFMFTDDLEFAKFAMAASGTSSYKGAHKHIVISSIAKHMGLKWSISSGLLARDSGKLLSKDPDYIAEILLGKGKDRSDLESVETLLDALKNDPERDEKLLDARETLAKEGIILPESINEAVAGYDREDYGNWTIDMSQKPVKMPKLTGDTAMFVARATHKRKDIQVFGKGTSQAAAREDAFAQIKDTTRSADPDAFKSFTIDLNVDFTKEYMDDKTGNYFKMSKDDSGEPVLIMANQAYFANFGREMEDLGFRKAKARTAPGPNATPIYSLPIGKTTVKALNLIPNMRYTLSQIDDDADGNAQFSLNADTRTTGPQDKYQMRRPGMTLAASLAEALGQLKGTDVAKTVKPQTFSGSQPHPFQGMLVGDATTTEAKKKPKPTSPDKWARAKAKARSKFEVYPSAYANAWAAKEYKRMGGGWRMG